MQTNEQPLSARTLRVLFPLFLLALVWAITPATRDTAGPIKTLITHWSVFVMAVVMLFGSLLERRAIQRPPIVFWPIIGILALYAMAAGLSAYWGHSFQYVANWGALTLLYLVASYAYRTPEQIHGGAFAFCVAVAAASLYGFLQWAGLDPFPWAEEGMGIYEQLPASFGNPNFAAHALLLSIILNIRLLTTRYQIPATAMLIISLLHLYMTQQRASLLGLAAAAAVLVSAQLAFRYVKRPVTATGAALGLSALIGVAGLGAALTWHHVRAGNWYPVDGSLLLRYNSYHGAARMILDQPVTGYGPGNYEIVNANYWTDYEQHWYATQRMFNQNVHNDYLEMAVDAGMPAAALYLAILIFAVGHSLYLAYSAGEDRRRRYLGYTLAAFFTAFAVDSFFGFNLRVPVTAALLFVALGWLEGLHLGAHAPPAAKWLGFRAAAWRVAVVGAALGVAILTTRVYLGETATQRGRGAMYWGIPHAAPAHFTEAERLKPWDWAPSRERAMAHLSLEQPERALEALRLAEQKNPYYPETLIPLAHTAMAIAVTPPQPGADSLAAAERMALLQEAKAVARRGIDLCEPAYEFHEIKGKTLAFEAAQLTQDEAAAAELWARVEPHAEKALRYGSPSQGEMFRLMAHARLALGRPDDAEEALTRGVEREPANLSLWRLFLRYAQNQGRFDVFEQAAHTALDRADLPAEARAELHQTLAQTLQQRDGDPERIEEHLLNVCEFAPQSPRTWELLAGFARESGQTDAIRRGLERAQVGLEGEGTLEAAIVDVLVTAYEGGDPEYVEAVESLRDLSIRAAAGAEAPSPSLHWAADLLVDELAQRNLAEDAAGSVLLRLAKVYFHAHAYDDALQLLASAFPLIEGADRATAFALQAETQLAQGEHEAAVRTLRQAIVEEPGNVHYRAGYARVLAQAGQTEEARAQYEMILDSPELDEESRALLQQEMTALDH